MEPRHQAVAAGLALTLAFGAVQAPPTAFAETAPEQASTADGEAAADGESAGSALAAPSDYDKADFFEDEEAQGFSLFFLRAASPTRITPMSLSSEMKYFAKYESGCDYDQGFSAGDGYNALGYYQFDRRYGLVDFMAACYRHNPKTYAAFKAVIERGDELKGGEIYSKGAFTSIGKLANDAWHAAYKANPTEFSQLQDAWAYQEYYTPVQNTLKSKFGVDISKRADCVKGLCWGLSNLFGPSGCQKFFRDARISDDMTDREFVTAVCDAVIDGVAGYYPKQPQYHKGWINRYKKEKATCLAYIAEDEAAAKPSEPTEPEEKPGESAPQPDTKPEEKPNDTPATGEDDSKPEGDAPSKPSTGGNATVVPPVDGAQRPGSDAAGDAGKDDAGSKDDVSSKDDASGKDESNTNGESDKQEGSTGGDKTPSTDSDSSAGGSDDKDSGKTPAEDDKNEKPSAGDSSNDSADKDSAGKDEATGGDGAESEKKPSGSTSDAGTGSNGGVTSGDGEKDASEGDGKTEETNPVTNQKDKGDPGNKTPGKETTAGGSKGAGNKGGAASGDARGAKVASNKQDDEPVNEAGLPQTGDATAMVTAVSAGLAGVGAVATFAGAHGLKRLRDEDGDSNESQE